MFDQHISKYQVTVQGIFLSASASRDSTLRQAGDLRAKTINSAQVGGLGRRRLALGHLPDDIRRCSDEL